MIVESKYNVGDLVHSKWSRNRLRNGNTRKMAGIFEIIEINIQTCYAGTQVWYTCRVVEPMMDSEVKEGKYITSVKDVTIGFINAREPYVRIREDELKAISDEMRKMIESVSDETEEVPPTETL